jgi:hypothetical protein
MEKTSHLLPPSRVKEITKKEKRKAMPPSPFLLRVKITKKLQHVSKSFKKKNPHPLPLQQLEH